MPFGNHLPWSPGGPRNLCLRNKLWQNGKMSLLTLGYKETMASNLAHSSFEALKEINCHFPYSVMWQRCLQPTTVVLRLAKGLISELGGSAPQVELRWLQPWRPDGSPVKTSWATGTQLSCTGIPDYGNCEVINVRCFKLLCFGVMC